MLGVWLLISQALVQTAFAQTSDVNALMAAYPTCSLECMLQYIPKSTCMTSQGLNQTCVCNNEELNHEIEVCARQSCTVKEMLKTMNVSSVACQRPVRDNSMDMTIIGFTIGGFALLTFIVRILTRLTMHAETLFWDDWMMLMAVLVSGPPTVFAWFLTDNGLGRDIWKLEFHQITNVLEFFFLGELFYFLGLGFVKVSLLCFLYRLFPVRNVRRATMALLVLSASYGITFFFATLFQCRPMRYMWEQWHGEVPGTCNDFHVQGWIAGGMDILIDLMILVLPLKPLSQLQISLQKKISILIMFMVGGLSTVIGMIRLKYLVQFAHTENPTWDYFEPGYWSLVEVQVAIICGNLPALYQLLRAWKPKLVSGTSPGLPSHSTPTPDIKGAMVHGRFVNAGAPRIGTMDHHRSDSTEYLQWGGDVDSNTLELQSSRVTSSPGLNKTPPGQAY